jgi:PII-like signaling protein
VEGASPREANLLRVYTLAGDRVGRLSLAEAVIRAARAAELMGATVLPAVSGYGRHGYEPELVVLAHRPERQPWVVEIVDSPDRLIAFLPTLGRLNRWRRLVTLERIRLYAYGTDSPPSGA